MQRLLNYFIPEEDQSNVKYQQLAIFLLVCQLVAFIFGAIRIGLSGLNVSAAPSIFGSMVIASLLLGLRNGLSLKSVTTVFGVVVFGIMITASTLNGGVQGPLYHLNILSLMLFPYFLNQRFGLKLNLLLIFIVALSEWASLHVSFQLMRLDGDALIWASRLFFMVRLALFIAVVQVLTADVTRSNKNVMMVSIFWLGLVLYLFFGEGDVYFLQSLIYPIIFFIFPKFDWEFRVMFIAANITLGFLYTIHVDPNWLPGVSASANTIWSNFTGFIVAMLLILLIQIKDFKHKGFSS